MAAKAVTGDLSELMTTRFLAFPPDTLARDAIAGLRAMALQGPVEYAYLTETDGRLAGVLNMRDLLLAQPEAPLRAVARGTVVSIRATASREELADAAEAARFLSLPVVDETGRLLGTVRSEAVLANAREQAHGSFLRVFGAGEDERAFSPIAFGIRMRLPWLVVNLATAFLAAGVVGLFEDTIAKVSVLAVFLPIVAGQGGNAGAQSLAVVMRGLAMKEIPPGAAGRLVAKEGTLGFLNGLVVAAATALGAYVWQGNPALGAVIGAAMLVNMAAAGVSGAAIPLVMKRLGFDPAQSSSIIQTTVTDIVGFAAFLGFASLAMPYLQ